MSGTGGRTPEDGKGEASPTPRPRRTRGKGPASDTTAGDNSFDELRATLADRERQLRDLTEQSLDLLDRLAEAQRRDTEHNAAAQRAEELARQLDDARRRLRTAGGAVLRDGADPAFAPSVDVVLWGGDAASVRARLDALAETAAVTWVGQAKSLPTWAGAEDRVQWIVADEARTPAQCWNLAMAATRADAVLFLAPSARLAGAPDVPATVGDPSIALVQPACARGEALELGLSDALELPTPAPTAATGAASAPVEIPFANPAAFLVRRRAFEAVGVFDEALLGELALAEFGLRAHARGFRTLGMPALRVELGSTQQRDPHAPRDRLLVLASHRPAALGPALAEDATLWELEPGATAPFVADLFARLPDGHATTSAIAAILGSMVASAAPATKVIASLRELLATHVDLRTSPPVPDAADELASLTARVDAAPPSSIPEALAALDAVLAFERRWIPQQIEAARRAAESERELGDARREVQLLQEGLHVVAQAIDMVGHFEPARIRERLLDLRRDAEHLAGLLAAADAPSPTALIQELHRIRTQITEGRDAIAERDRRLADVEVRIAELTQTLAARASELGALNALLGERDHWIAALLAEVGKRRLLPRKLLDHERAFLAEQGRAP